MKQEQLINIYICHINDEKKVFLGKFTGRKKKRRKIEKQENKIQQNNN